MSVLSVTVVLIIGVLLVWPAFDSRQRSMPEILLRLALAVGFGFGVTSMGFFLALVLFQSGRRAAKVGDLFLLVLMLLVVFWQLRKRERKSLLVIPARGNPY